MRKFLMAAAMVAGATGAQAADMPNYPLRGGYVEGVRPLWDGFYIGGQGSQAWLKTQDTTNSNAAVQAAYTLRTGLVPGAIIVPRNAEGRKAAYGGFAGYNAQYEDVVVGVEANYLHSDVASNAIAYTLPNAALQAQSSVKVAMQDFGSVRVRGGYMIGSFLPYGFAGFSAGSAEVTRSAGATFNAGVPVTFPFETTQKNLFLYGYTAGFGVDVLLAGGVFARAEYEFSQFTNKTIKANVNTVKVGLGYRF